MEEQAKIIEISIKSYEKREQAAKEKCMRALIDGLYEAASRAVVEAAKCRACIEELEYQQDCL